MTAKLQNIPYDLLIPSEDPPNADLIYSALGRVTVSWGRFENQLDFGLLSILRLCEARPIRPKLKSGEPMPAAFKEKAKLWRKAFRKIPALAPYRREALAIMLTATDLAERRHSIVHGNWNNFRSADPIQIVGVHFRLKANSVLIKKHTATQYGFEQIACTIRDLSLQMCSLLGTIYPVIKREPVDTFPLPLSAK